MAVSAPDCFAHDGGNGLDTCYCITDKTFIAIQQLIQTDIGFSDCLSETGKYFLYQHCAHDACNATEPKRGRKPLPAGTQENIMTDGLDDIAMAVQHQPEIIFYKFPGSENLIQAIQVLYTGKVRIAGQGIATELKPDKIPGRGEGKPLADPVGFRSFRKPVAPASASRGDYELQHPMTGNTGKHGAQLIYDEVFISAYAQGSQATHQAVQMVRHQRDASPESAHGFKDAVSIGKAAVSNIKPGCRLAIDETEKISHVARVLVNFSAKYKEKAVLGKQYGLDRW